MPIPRRGEASSADLFFRSAASRLKSLHNDRAKGTKNRLLASFR
jgi:hypothetical protein